MLILRLLLDYPCAKAVLDDAFDYAPHNDTPVLAQPFPEEVGESSDENPSSELQGMVSKHDAAGITGVEEELGSPHQT